MMHFVIIVENYILDIDCYGRENKGLVYAGKAHFLFDILMVQLQSYLQCLM